MTMMVEDRFAGCLLGLACGDALGAAREFMPRGTFSPLTDMVGGGPHGLNPGEWTDDTSMALCLAESLIECYGHDPLDQMNRYCDWKDHGYLSSTGDCFDIGNTILAALNQFQQTGDPISGSTDPYSAGNGSIMRLAPVPMYYHGDIEKVVDSSAESSKTTHGAPEAVDACRLFGVMLSKSLAGMSKEEILDQNDYEPVTPKLRAIAKGSYKEKAESQVVGSGYVVQSLEAALYCFYQTTNYRDAILQAANLGDDADTTAAVCGQIAGAYYGKSGIPNSWLDLVSWREYIEESALALMAANSDRGPAAR
jgi:ADP-ribosyl-[dinitrogen reductase] hydrolase